MPPLSSYAVGRQPHDAAGRGEIPGPPAGEAATLDGDPARARMLSGFSSAGRGRRRLSRSTSGRARSTIAYGWMMRRMVPLEKWMERRLEAPHVRTWGGKSGFQLRFESCCLSGSATDRFGHQRWVGLGS